MKDSSIAILAALAVSGAAGVYLATRDASNDLVRDPSAKKVADPSAQRADPYAGGSSGADASEDGYITKGELCKRVREDIPEAQKRLDEERDALEQFEGEAREIAQQYRSEIYGGSRSKNNRREEEMFQHILTGSPIVIGPDRGKTPSAATESRIEDAKRRVASFETRIETMTRRLGELDEQYNDLLSQGVC